MLELHYSLSKEDHLNFQLYAASHSPRVKKQRLRGQIIVFLSLIIIGIFMQDGSAFGLSNYVFFIMAVLSIFLYPTYFKWYYKRHFKKHVEETFDLDNSSMVVQLNDLTIEAQGEKTTSSIKLQELLSFVETRDYFYLQLGKATYIPLPKGEIPINQVKEYLLDRSKDLSIPYKQELDWKWE